MLPRTLSIFFISLPLVACSAGPVEDDLAGERADEGEAGKADDHGTFTYFEIERDQRRCVAPMCGGFWVNRVQRAKTECAGGARRASCYVAELDTASLGVVDELLPAIEAGRVLVRGTIVDNVHPDFGNVGRLVVDEAWVAGAAAGAPDGVFVAIEQTGVRCIAAPCADKAEYKLNSTRTAMIADLDFEPSGATDDEIAKAFEALAGETAPGGLIVVGDRYYVEGAGGTAKARTVTQFYTRLGGGDPAQGECFVGGCSGQVCSDQPDVITTCEWREEYACYADATCERQAGGACGWTMTAELEACLASAS